MRDDGALGGVVDGGADAVELLSFRSMRFAHAAQVIPEVEVYRSSRRGLAGHFRAVGVWFIVCAPRPRVSEHVVAGVELGVQAAVELILSAGLLVVLTRPLDAQ